MKVLIILLALLVIMILLAFFASFVLYLSFKGDDYTEDMDNNLKE